MKIALSQIKDSPRPVRKSWDESKLDELAQSIAEQGLIVPIKVRPLDLGEYEIVYGHRRAEACRRLGWHEIAALVEGMDDSGAYWQSLIENIVREDMTDLEEGQAFLAIQEDESFSNRDIGRRIGCVHSYVARRIALARDDNADKWSGLDQAHAGDVASKAQVIRGATETPSTRDALTTKVIEEEISEPHLKQIARAVKVAETIERPDERAAVIQELIETPYDPRIHNERAVQTRKEHPRPDRKNVNAFQWALQPGAKNVLDFLQDFESKLDRRRDEWYESVESGKFSPEATQFIANRMRRIASTLNTIAEGYEDYEQE